MECYFGSYQLPKRSGVDKSSVVMFHIPELGIRFKAPFDAVDHDHSDFAALLALLEFIDSNQKFIAVRTFEIYGDNLTIVNCVNARDSLPMQYSPLMEKAKQYREKYRFSLDWISVERNAALESLSD